MKKIGPTWCRTLFKSSIYFSGMVADYAWADTLAEIRDSAITLLGWISGILCPETSA